MTLRYEEKNALNYTREFLYALLDSKKIPRIPKAVRKQALRLLHHYPGKYTVEDYFNAKMLQYKSYGASKLDLNIQYGKK